MKLSKTSKKPVLTGQVAVVTGAARGLGRVGAEALAGLGADIVAIDLDAADETVAAITAAGGRAAAYQADLTAEVQVEEVFEEVIVNGGATFGGL